MTTIRDTFECKAEFRCGSGWVGWLVVCGGVVWWCGGLVSVGGAGLVWCG